MNAGAHASFPIMISSKVIPNSGVVGSHWSFIPCFCFFKRISTLLYEAGSSDPVLCENLEGCGGVGGGGRFKRETCVYLWLILVDVWQKATRYCKVIMLQLKINKLFF